MQCKKPDSFHFINSGSRFRRNTAAVPPVKQQFPFSPPLGGWRLAPLGGTGRWRPLLLLLTMNDPVMADEIVVDSGVKFAGQVFPFTEANLTTHCHLEIAAHWDFQWMKLLSCSLGGPTTSLCKFWRVYFSPQARATDWPRWYSGQSTDVEEKRPPFKSGVLSVRKEKKSCQR